ncbi:nuclease-related domain-containing protein [Ornithinimicrobium murale]|uniref:nuclease-related domain-containing protein n=1 Tax=Ornithinimicrobium murale TaxID=1050153 RepID=UPI000E0DBA46|nr:nuclease-related domain-containing protein [Ornithinimicrobium murale]
MAGPKTTHPVTIIGRAGGGLDNATWAKSTGHARAGKQAELSTAAVLDEWARNNPGVAVLHDLDVPRAGYTANVDHVVVSGNSVMLLDAKSWAPGFVWSLGQSSYRGLKPFPSAAKRTLPMALDTYTEHLARHGVTGIDIRCALVVWCSRREGKVSTWALASPGARVIPGLKLAANPRRYLPRKPADPAITSALAQLVN